MGIRIRRVPYWKQAIGVACAAYCLAVWALPVMLLPFFNILPYLHTYGSQERLLLSTAGTALLLVVMWLSDPEQFSRAFRMSGTRWSILKHWIGVTGGLAMFTFAGAAFSANLLGGLVRVLPGERFKSVEVVESVEFSGSRYKSVNLVVRGNVNGRVRYLTLSKRLFEYPRFREGDILSLQGKQNLFGAYVDDFEVVGN